MEVAMEVAMDASHAAQVGKDFTRAYYSVMAESPENLHR